MKLMQWQLFCRYWHLEKQTKWDFPNRLRRLISEVGRCLPQTKHDFVALE
jgi:Holliday junction resolvasome RuvABC endonuclease subunit